MKTLLILSLITIKTLTQRTIKATCLQTNGVTDRVLYSGTPFTNNIYTIPAGNPSNLCLNLHGGDIEFQTEFYCEQQCAGCKVKYTKTGYSTKYSEIRSNVTWICSETTQGQNFLQMWDSIYLRQIGSPFPYDWCKCAQNLSPQKTSALPYGFPLTPEDISLSCLQCSPNTNDACVTANGGPFSNAVVTVTQSQCYLGYNAVYTFGCHFSCSGCLVVATYDSGLTEAVCNNTLKGQNYTNILNKIYGNNTYEWCNCTQFLANPPPSEFQYYTTTTTTTEGPISSVLIGFLILVCVLLGVLFLCILVYCILKATRERKE